MNRLIFNPIGDSYALVSVLAGLLIVALALVPRGRRLAMWQHAALAGARLAVVVFLLLVMLRPTLVYMEKQKQTATVAVLLDRSESMTTRDAYGGTSRYAAMREMFDEALPQLRALAEQLTVKLYLFDRDVQPYRLDAEPLELPMEPTGVETAIGAALEEVVRREAGGRIAAVILAGDGTQRTLGAASTPPQEPARRLADLDSPLYTIVFGQARGKEQGRDLALESPLAPRFVFEKNPLTVSGEVHVEGYANQNLPVQLLFENAAGAMEIVASTNLRATDSGERVPFELEHVPDEPGEYKLTVRVVRQEGERDTNNNEWTSFVTVRPGGLSVLYIEGQRRVEQRFLRWSLDASPDIQVDFLFVNHHNPQNRGVDLSRYFSKANDAAERTIPRYDVYILGDVDASVFRPQDLTELTRRIEEGAGLIMIGGYHTFAPGGYYDTPLAAVLPITMDRHVRQDFGKPILAKAHLAGPLTMVPAPPVGTRHPVMRLDEPDKNLAAWRKLPPLTGANRFGLSAIKPGTTGVLAETDGANPEPLLVAGNYGEGRVLALAVDSTWRWWMQGHEMAHRKFWRQIVLFLAKVEQKDESSVWVDLAQRRYRANQLIEFQVGATSPEGAAVTDAQFTAKVTLPDKTSRRVRLARRTDHFKGIFPTGKAQATGLMAGDYVLDVSATRAGKSLGAAQVRFTVEETRLELDNPVADPSLMTAIADITREAGGRRIQPKELTDLLDELAKLPAELEVEKQVKVTYYDRPWLLFVFVSLLGAEWFLRKRWGLV